LPRNSRHLRKNGKDTITRILLTGGGSGGHVTPLLAIADALRTQEPETHLLYVGVRSGLEASLVPRAGIQLRFAPSRGMPSSPLSPSMLLFLLTLSVGVLKALWHLVTFRPNAIVASGGYASAPTVFAAQTLASITFGLWRIPIYMHEQNAVPGRMNRFAARFVTRIGLSHASSAEAFSRRSVEVVGYPVRSSFGLIDRKEARKRLNLTSKDIYLLVFGGSQGARTLNRAIVDALPHLSDLDSLVIMHACGAMRSSVYDAHEDTLERVEALEKRPQRYTLVEYLHDLPVHLAAADIAVIRAGAGSLIEVCSAGVPALVIPKANLPGDSQVANARDLAMRGAIEVLYEEPTLEDGALLEAVDGEVLANRIRSLATDSAKRRKLARKAQASADLHAAARIARRVLTLARGTSSMTLNGDEPPPVISENASVPRLPQHPTALRRHIESKLNIQWESAFDHGIVRNEELDRLGDLSYLRYRATTLLAHPMWQYRNEGVKMTGLLRHENKMELVLHMLTDRTPAKRLHRYFGGDFEQVGFIRRNALGAVALIGGYDREDVQEGVHAALQDPYYEVRSSALRLVRRFAHLQVGMDKQIAADVIKLTADPNLEVRWEALHTAGLVAQPEAVIEACRPHVMAPQAPIRDAVLRAYLALLERFPNSTGERWQKKLIADLDHFAITSVAFHPFFPLKDRYTALRKRLREEQS
jgi:UDP-N-acetylglucosamine--N-acetylmuramyl-(pentapeptide) pyrophosphoryl-undecaprenol N-acetylglucosamine transferase